MKQIRQALVFSAGVFLILLGIIGLVLPILQGWLLIFLGLSLIAPRLAERLRRRFFRRFFKSDLIYLEEWKKTNVEAGFTTRHFSLVLKNTEELLSRENQTELIRLFSKSAVASSHKLLVPDKLVLLRQVHGSGIRVLRDAQIYKASGLYPIEAVDGAITQIKGLTLLVFSADCLPIFFVCGDWVGIAHAGWRGTKGRIAAAMVENLCKESGLPPSDVRAVFGPCISASHYEVGEEFGGYFRSSSLVRKAGKLCFDLAKENEAQLIEAGMPAKNISNHDICTYSEGETFYSFRREGQAAGRIISFITKVA